MRRRIGILSAATLLAAVFYFFVLSPVYHLYRAWHVMHPMVAEVKVDLRAQHDRSLVLLLPQLLPALKNADMALGRLHYLAWGPYVRNTYASADSMINTLYLAVQGADHSQILRVVGDSKSGSTHAAVDSVMAHWPMLAGSLQSSVSSWQKAAADATTILPDALPQSMRGPAIQLHHWGVIGRPMLNTIATIVDHPTRWGRLLGVSKPAHYLILFQNSGELRASGGLITAYGMLTVKDGHIGAVSPINTARLAMRSTIPAPFPFRHYFGQRFLSFENASDNPDVPQVARTVEDILKMNHQLGPIQGIVFVNTGLVDTLLQVFGPLTVPKLYTGGRRIILSADNANVKMEYIAEESGLSHSIRKQFIGAVMAELVRRAMNARGANEITLLHTMGAALHHKELLLYVNDRSAEAKLRQWGWAGAISRRVSGDYLEVVDENLGGHKDNYFLQQQVSTSLAATHGKTLVTTAITWTMPVVADGWLTVGYPGWVEIYVPHGSTLISMTGAGTHDDRTVEDIRVNKTIFEGTFYISNKRTEKSPPVVKTMVVRYWLPKGLDPHQLLVQLQPGVPSERLVVRENGMTVANVVERSDLDFHW